MIFENVKFKIKTPEDSIALQKELFSKGYKWNIHGQNVCYSTKEFLYISEFGLISYGEDEAYFNRYDSPQGEYSIKTVCTFEVIDTVRFNGKTYRKSDIEEALAKLEPIE